jgi:hypothetical protein
LWERLGEGRRATELPALRLRPARLAEVPALRLSMDRLVHKPYQQQSRLGTRQGSSRFVSAEDKTDRFTILNDWFTSNIDDSRVSDTTG